MFKKLKERLKESISKLTKSAKEEVLKKDAGNGSIGAELEEDKDISVDSPVEGIVQEGYIPDVIDKNSYPERSLSQESKGSDEEPVVSKDRQTTKDGDIDKDDIPAESKAEDKKHKEKGIFKKAREIFTTRRISESKFDELFWDMEVALLENNVSFEVVNKIKKDLRESIVDKQLPRSVAEYIRDILIRSIEEIISLENIDMIDMAGRKRPFIIALFGINGSGKTTTIAKLAYIFKNKGKKVVLAAADTFRAAAIDQLEEHAKKLDVRMIKHQYGSDSAAVAYDAVRYAENNDIDIVLIDTAGRLHSNTNLMDELEKICRVVKPDLKIFIGESITGNDCIEQAKEFSSLIGFDGIILTKADIDEKGGAPLSISYITKRPILFIGTGQEYGDLKPFDKDEVMKNLGLKE